MKQEILCRGCTIKFIPKHGNQLYHDKKCQQDFNNAKGKTTRDEKKAVQKPLDNNFKILKKILGTAKFVNKSREYLDGAGYNFFHFTAKSYTDSKLPAWRVFNYILIELSPIEFQILKQNETK